MTAAAAGGATSAPAAPANGAASQTQAPAPGTESVPQTPAQGAPSATKPPAKPPEQPWKAKRKLKIGGQEREIEYDDRRLQILEHNLSQKAEFERQQAEFNARLAKLTEDPDSLFQEVGFDVDKYLAQRAERQKALEAMDPRERAYQEREAAIARREAQLQKQAEQRRVEAEQQENQQFIQQNVQRLGKAIELSGLPRSGELVRLYAEVQEMAAHAGEPEMSPEQLHVAGERLMAKRMATLLKAASNEGWRQRNAPALQELAKAVLPSLEGDALLDWVGKDNATRIVKALHAKTRTSPVPIVQEAPPVAQSNGTTQARPGQPTTEWDILDRLGA